MRDLSSVRALLAILVVATSGGCEGARSPSEQQSSGEQTGALTLGRPTNDAILEVATWNVEMFGHTGYDPADDALQRQNAAHVIEQADIPLWGLVEITSAAAFDRLLAALPGYDGFIGSDPLVLDGDIYDEGFSTPAIVYDPSVITVQSAEVVLAHCEWEFAWRPPLHATLTVELEGTTHTLHLLVLHMKARADRVSYNRRQAAGACLYDYLSQNLTGELVLVVGDFNDDVDVSIVSTQSHSGCVSAGSYCESPYQALVDSPLMGFTTVSLSAAHEPSMVSWPETIDHHLATSGLVARYQRGSARVLRPDLWIPSIPSYATTTSDHYPVAARYVLATRPRPPVTAFFNEVMYATGGTWADFDQEFVEVLNATTGTLDVSGWSIEDATRVRHTFPAGTLLAPGQAIVVFGGASAIPPGLTNAVAASEGSLHLEPEDTVMLRDASGRIRDEHSFSELEDPRIDDVSDNRAPDGDPAASFVPHSTLMLRSLRRSSPGLRADGSPW